MAFASKELNRACSRMQTKESIERKMQDANVSEVVDIEGE
jgi:hypothetical protein